MRSWRSPEGLSSDEAAALETLQQAPRQVAERALGAAALLPLGPTRMKRAARVERTARPRLRELADQAFSRAAGAPLIGGNSVKLLRDAGENYPAWLAGIAAARHHVHCEIYFI